MGYFFGIVAAVAGAVMLRRYIRTRPRQFEFEGSTYVRHPDGSFTSAGGSPVISPQLERVEAYWNEQGGSGGSSGKDGNGGGD